MQAIFFRQMPGTKLILICKFYVILYFHKRVFQLMCPQDILKLKFHFCINLSNIKATKLQADFSPDAAFVAAIQHFKYNITKQNTVLCLYPLF